MEECKRCLLREIDNGDILESIRTRIEKLSDNDKVDDKVYQERLSKCKNCDHLISGVCMKCGCYVEFRAAFRKQKCPDVKNRKW
ncbi:MAG TPA: hypothetical protein GXZ23_00825 [Clostridiales bacterium]|nr:hypothetical protein [Clostridiales bacterium]